MTDTKKATKETTKEVKEATKKATKEATKKATKKAIYKAIKEAIEEATKKANNDHVYAYKNLCMPELTQSRYCGSNEFKYKCPKCKTPGNTFWCLKCKNDRWELEDESSETKE